METTWTEIKAVTSVQDSYYFDKRGEAFASAGLPDLDTPALHGIGRQAALTLNVAIVRMKGDGRDTEPVAGQCLTPGDGWAKLIGMKNLGFY
ncbi:MAG: hypothetical protein KAS38_01355 [Anaerolineales bacterium]|nr:hypothetical protein [Anaerolineales bacterium]